MTDLLLPRLTDAEWHKLRARHVGGSEVAALFGVQPDYAMSHYTLWMVKAGKIPRPEVNGDRPKWGLRLEQVIAEAAAEQEGWSIEKGGYISSQTVRGLGATLDYLILGNPPGVLECKNADWLQFKRGWTDGEPPLHILLQLQHQLAASGHTWGAVAALVGGNQLEVYRYERRPKIIADIERRVAAFWDSIDADKPPPVDGSDSTARALAALFTGGGDELVDMKADNELPELCAQLLRHGEARRVLEKAEQAAKNRIMAKLGNHHGAECVGFRLRATEVAASADKLITPEMVGTVIKGRAGYRKLTVKELT